MGRPAGGLLPKSKHRGGQEIEDSSEDEHLLGVRAGPALGGDMPSRALITIHKDSGSTPWPPLAVERSFLSTEAVLQVSVNQSVF